MFDLLSIYISDNGSEGCTVSTVNYGSSTQLVPLGFLLLRVDGGGSTSTVRTNAILPKKIWRTAWPTNLFKPIYFWSYM